MKIEEKKLVEELKRMHPDDQKVLLIASAENHCLTLVKLLVKAGTKMNDVSFLERSPERKTALMYAISTKWREDKKHLNPERLELIRFLVSQVKKEKGSKDDLNRTDKNYMTALHHASEGGFIEVVQILIENGANLLAKNGKKETSLDLAIERGHKEVVRLLAIALADSAQ